MKEKWRVLKKLQLKPPELEDTNHNSVKTLLFDQGMENLNGITRTIIYCAYCTDRW